MKKLFCAMICMGYLTAMEEQPHKKMKLEEVYLAPMVKSLKEKLIFQVVALIRSGKLVSSAGTKQLTKELQAFVTKLAQYESFEQFIESMLNELHGALNSKNEKLASDYISYLFDSIQNTPAAFELYLLNNFEVFLKQIIAFVKIAPLTSASIKYKLLNLFDNIVLFFKKSMDQVLANLFIELFDHLSDQNVTEGPFTGQSNELDMQVIISCIKRILYLNTYDHFLSSFELPDDAAFADFFPHTNEPTILDAVIVLEDEELIQLMVNYINDHAKKNKILSQALQLNRKLIIHLMNQMIKKDKKFNGQVLLKMIRTQLLLLASLEPKLAESELKILREFLDAINKQDAALLDKSQKEYLAKFS